MFVRFDVAKVDGVLSIDGYIDATTYAPTGVATFITTRVAQFSDDT